MRYGWKDLTPINQVIEKTRQRAKNHPTWDIDQIAEMGIEYTDSHPHLKSGNGGYIAKQVLDSKKVPMLLSESAIRGACRLIGAKPSFFEDAEDRNALPKFLKNKLDNPNRSGEHAFKFRTGYATDENENGFYEVVDAILPGSYQVRDAHEQLAGFAELIHENLGPIKGVMVDERGFGEMLSYRMVVGDNIMPNVKDEATGQFLAFNLRMSETGAISDETALGLYRLVCQNGALSFDGRQIGKWSHKTPLSDYLNKAGGSIHAASGMASTWGKIFAEMNEATLKHPAADYLEMMRARQLITKAHHGMAENHAKSGLEPVSTHYDLFNLLTRGAQDLSHPTQRHKAERETLRMFTSGGGFIESLDKARMNVERKEARINAGLVNPDAPGSSGKKSSFASRLKAAIEEIG